MPTNRPGRSAPVGPAADRAVRPCRRTAPPPARRSPRTGGSGAAPSRRPGCHGRRRRTGPGLSPGAACGAASSSPGAGSDGPDRRVSSPPALGSVTRFPRLSAFRQSGWACGAGFLWGAPTDPAVQERRCPQSCPQAVETEGGRPASEGAGRSSTDANPCRPAVGKVDGGDANSTRDRTARHSGELVPGSRTAWVACRAAGV